MHNTTTTQLVHEIERRRQASAERIEIRHYAIKNPAPAGGWLPVFDLNGRQQGHTYWPHGWDKEQAQQIAQAQANECASRYVGDWDISVEPKAVA